VGGSRGTDRGVATPPPIPLPQGEGGNLEHPSLSRRHLLAALLPLTALTACGFQPVYMPTATGKPGVAQRELASVSVGIIPDRPGQLLRQALQQRMASDGGGQRRYDLRVTYWISGEGVSILGDSSATRLRLTAYANWSLVSNDTAQVRLTNGQARAIDAMNVFDQQFFALDLQNETVQQRLAEQVAEQITTQLALWFREQAAKTAAG
jgi:LPS-assembly lipoprotein